jgi:hypothetical protein
MTDEEFEQMDREDEEAMSKGPEAFDLLVKKRMETYRNLTRQYYAPRDNNSNDFVEAVVAQSNNDLEVFSELETIEPVAVASEVLLQIGYEESQVTNILSVYDEDESKLLWKNLISGYSHEQIWLILAPYNQVNNLYERNVNFSKRFGAFNVSSQIFMTESEILAACKGLLNCEVDDVFTAFRMFINLIGNMCPLNMKRYNMDKVYYNQSEYRIMSGRDDSCIEQELVLNGKMIRHENCLEITGLCIGPSVQAVVKVRQVANWENVLAKFVLDLRDMIYVSKSWMSAADLEARNRLLKVKDFFD